LELELIRKGRPLLELLAKMIYELETNEINVLQEQAVSDNAFDIGEKIVLAKRKEIDRVRLTLNELSDIAVQEIKHRVESKKLQE